MFIYKYSINRHFIPHQKLVNDLLWKCVQCPNLSKILKRIAHISSTFRAKLDGNHQDIDELTRNFLYQSFSLNIPTKD